MDDEQILELFFERNEDALAKEKKKYGRYCGIIVKNVIGSASDAEECVNDTLLDVWNSIPPNKPENLRTYVGKIARNNALDRLKRDTAKKRGGEMKAIVDELADISSEYSVEAVAE